MKKDEANYKGSTVNLSYKIIEDMLKYSSITTSVELLSKMEKARDVAQSGSYPIELRLAYMEAVKQVRILSNDEVKELKKMFK